MLALSMGIPIFSPGEAGAGSDTAVESVSKSRSPSAPQLSVSLALLTPESPPTPASSPSAPSASTPLTPKAAADTLSELIDAVSGANRMIAAMTAMRAELIDQTRLWSEFTDPAGNRGNPNCRELARRALRAELACELRMPERTIENLLGVSEALVHDFRPTFEALLAGEISYRHAQILIDNTASLGHEAKRDLERQELVHARALSAAKFDRKVRVLRERLHPETITERCQRAAADREVLCTGGRDGMAWLSAYLPAPDALAVYNRVSDIAISLQAPDEARTLTQLRADAFRDLLLDDDNGPAGSAFGEGLSDDGLDDQRLSHQRLSENGLGENGLGDDGLSDDENDADHLPSRPNSARFRGIRPRVLVTVPVLTLLGRSDEPGTLDGYGPIDPETARELAGRASSFIRLLTHPETGAVLSVGKTRYRVPEDLRTWLGVRDGSCRFPGCNRSTSHCDVDHTIDWAFGGETRYDNLAHLCPSHHVLKHATRWQVVQARDGTAALHWTSP
ncbi:MAG: HNH endonuclease signature motif containing protein, partial [Microbacteriaceae bacterium]